MYHSVIGFLGMIVWGALCGFPALALYSVVMQDRAGWRPWLLILGLVVLWFPAVTLLCLWAVLTLTGMGLPGSP
ncbi:MAG TPA: hypothetical protein VFE65_26740 [Pseudonocardia sp.]|jgi:hypothetical protein|nr:hypothetical protein [Pseudonocardia sp.]